MRQILLAEDNPGDVILVQHALEEHKIDHQLYVVKDGVEALTFMSQMGLPGRSPCPDLLLLDLNLPKVTGPQVLEKFRAHPMCSQTPVVIVTSSDAQTDRANMERLGIAHYFRKPSSLTAFFQLGAIVRKILGQPPT